MRKDLKLPPGKMAAQAAHASVEAVLRTDPLLVRKWRQNGAKKVVLLATDGTINSLIFNADKNLNIPIGLCYCVKRKLKKLFNVYDMKKIYKNIF